MRCDMGIEYEKLSESADEELVVRSQEGDSAAQDYILDKYKTLVKSKARSYFMSGGDKEDIIQEGMIGLYKAIRDYMPEKSDSFRAFAELSISRQILTAIKAATRKKHIPLNSYVSLNKPASSDLSGARGGEYIELLRDASFLNPEALLIGEEDRDFIKHHILKSLSKMEKDVLSLYLSGKSYAAIAGILGKTEKSVDNSLQRVKRKISGALCKKRLDDK